MNNEQNINNQDNKSDLREKDFHEIVMKQYELINSQFNTIRQMQIDQEERDAEFDLSRLIPGFLRKKPVNDSNGIIVQTRPTKYDDSSNSEALLDYAERLEDQGNYEAAAKVRALIPQALDGEANQEIEKQMNSNPKINFIREFDETLDYVDLVK